MSPSTNFNRILTGVLIFLLASLIVAERWHTRDEPAERDSSTYAVTADQILHGRSLYCVVPEQKPPAAIITYAGAEMLFGYDKGILVPLSIIAALITLIAAFRAGSVFGKPAACISAIVWAFLCMDCLLQANQPNTEVFINACTLWAFSLLIDSVSSGVSGRRAIAVGLLFAWASLYKPVIFPICVLIYATLIWVNWKSELRSYLIRAACVSFLVTVAIWLLVFGFFAAIGHLGQFIDCVITYNRTYAGNISDNERHLFDLAKLVPKPLHFVFWYIPVVALAIWITRRQEIGKLWTVWAAYLLGTLIAIAMPGRYYMHYYQLILPPLVVAVGWTVGSLASSTWRWGRVAAYTSAALVLIVVIAHETPYYWLCDNEWSERKYGSEFVDSSRLAHIIAPLLMPGERYYDAGSHPEIYLYLKREPITGYYEHGTELDQATERRYNQHVLGVLEHNPPDIITDDRKEPASLAVRSYTYQNYHLGLCVGQFRLFVRSGTRLGSILGVNSSSNQLLRPVRQEK